MEIYKFNPISFVTANKLWRKSDIHIGFKSHTAKIKTKLGPKEKLQTNSLELRKGNTEQ
jgi:hypothetical protein